MKRNVLTQSIINGLIFGTPRHAIPNPNCGKIACVIHEDPAGEESFPLELSEGRLNAVVQDQEFFYTPTLNGGSEPYSFGLAEGSDPLPDGLVFNLATGGISGTPTTPGQSATLIIEVTDGNGDTAQIEITLTVVTMLTVSDPDPLPGNPQVGVAYSYVPVIAGGVAPYSVVVDGSSDPVPDGLSVDPLTGELSGTPLPGSEGPALVVIRVSDASGQSAIAGISLNVQPA